MPLIADEKRIAKLKGILAKLKNGDNVQNRMLQTWLTPNEYAAIERDWDEQKELRKELKDKPEEIIEYEQRLKKALFAFARNAKNIDALFEGVMTYLQEIIQADPSLREWFDRDTEWGDR